MNPRSASPLFPVLLLLLNGCPSGRTQDGHHDAQPPASSTVAPTAPPVAAASASASAAPVPSASVESAAIPDSGPYTRGGTWATCMKGFRPESALQRDLIRLGMLCGPYHGMKKLGAPLTGKLAGKPVQHTVQASRGQCLRAFVVAADPVAGLKLRATAGDKQLAQVFSATRWAVLDDQGAWCAAEDTAITIELEAVSGQGDYAMQMWLLP